MLRGGGKGFSISAVISHVFPKASVTVCADAGGMLITFRNSRNATAPKRRLADPTRLAIPDEYRLTKHMTRSPNATPKYAVNRTKWPERRQEFRRPSTCLDDTIPFDVAEMQRGKLLALLALASGGLGLLGWRRKRKAQAVA
jgi:hypothetical protein